MIVGAPGWRPKSWIDSAETALYWPVASFSVTAVVLAPIVAWTRLVPALLVWGYCVLAAALSMLIFVLGSMDRSVSERQTKGLSATVNYFFFKGERPSMRRAYRDRPLLIVFFVLTAEMLIVGASQSAQAGALVLAGAFPAGILFGALGKRIPES